MFSFLHFVSCFMVGKRDHLLVKDTFLGLLFPSGFFADLNPNFEIKKAKRWKIQTITQSLTQTPVSVAKPHIGDLNLCDPCSNIPKTRMTLSVITPLPQTNKFSSLFNVSSLLTNIDTRDTAVLGVQTVIRNVRETSKLQNLLLGVGGIRFHTLHLLVY